MSKQTIKTLLLCSDEFALDCGHHYPKEIDLQILKQKIDEFHQKGVTHVEFIAEYHYEDTPQGFTINGYKNREETDQEYELRKKTAKEATDKKVKAAQQAELRQYERLKKIYGDK